MSACMIQTIRNRSDTSKSKGPEPKRKKTIMESELDKKIQNLIEMICNKKIMEETLKALKFDVDKAPLGKLTADQIKAGYKALSKIADVVNNKGKEKYFLLFSKVSLIWKSIAHCAKDLLIVKKIQPNLIPSKTIPI